MLRRTLAILLVALGCLPAAAQQFPNKVPDYTVVGRIGTGTSSGPAQSIPFATLAAKLFGVSPQPSSLPRKLLPVTTFYVDTTYGTDSALCGLASTALACRTPQYAYTLLQTSYDLGCQGVTIQLANGTYPAINAVSPLTGQCGPLIIQGNISNQANVVIDGAAGAYCVQATGYAWITVQGLTVQNCVNQLAATELHSQLFFQNITWGSIGSGGANIYPSRQAYIEMIGGGNILSAVSGGFIIASHQGNFRASGAATGPSPVTLSANLTLDSGPFVYAASGGDITFTGYSATPFNLNGFTVTGDTWIIDSGGIIQTLNQITTFFPGNNIGFLLGEGSYNGGVHLGTTILSGGGTSPTLAGGSNDFDGSVTEGSGSTGLVLTFAWPFDRPPFCQVSYGGTSPSNPTVSTSQTTLGTSHGAGAPTMYYHCHGG